MAICSRNHAAQHTVEVECVIYSNYSVSQKEGRHASNQYGVEDGYKHS